MQIKNGIRIVLVVALVLAVPLIAMQFTQEVAWDMTDFLVAGVLLLGAGGVYEFFTRNKSTKARIWIGVVIAIVLFLVWAELAVGIFNTPWAGS